MLESWNPVIIIHAVIATVALALGGFNVFRTVRGDPVHKAVGRIWSVLMIIISLTGLAIVARLSLDEMDFIDYFLTGISIWTIISICTAIWAAKKGKIALHKGFMLTTYIGLLGATVGVVSVPGRRVPSYFVQYPVLMTCIAVAIFTLSGFLLAAITRNAGNKHVT